MSGKCRPCLREKTLVNLDRASRAGYISMTDYKGGQKNVNTD